MHHVEQAAVLRKLMRKGNKIAKKRLNARNGKQALSSATLGIENDNGNDTRSCPIGFALAEHPLVTSIPDEYLFAKSLPWRDGHVQSPPERNDIDDECNIDDDSSSDSLDVDSLRTPIPQPSNTPASAIAGSSVAAMANDRMSGDNFAPLQLAPTTTKTDLVVVVDQHTQQVSRCPNAAANCDVICYRHNPYSFVSSVDVTMMPTSSGDMAFIDAFDEGIVFPHFLEGNDDTAQVAYWEEEDFCYRYPGRTQYHEHVSLDCASIGISLKRRKKHLHHRKPMFQLPTAAVIATAPQPPHQRDALTFERKAFGDAECAQTPKVMCCYFKQNGTCKMGDKCWYGHEGDLYTPCHYGAGCKAGHATLALMAEMKSKPQPEVISNIFVSPHIEVKSSRSLPAHTHTSYSIPYSIPLPHSKMCLTTAPMTAAPTLSTSASVSSLTKELDGNQAKPTDDGDGVACEHC